jgi:hypothetical protein
VIERIESSPFTYFYIYGYSSILPSILICLTTHHAIQVVLDAHRVCKPNYRSQQPNISTSSSLSPSSALGVGVGTPSPLPRARDGPSVRHLYPSRGGDALIQTGDGELFDRKRGGHSDQPIKRIQHLQHVGTRSGLADVSRNVAHWSEFPNPFRSW